MLVTAERSFDKRGGRVVPANCRVRIRCVKAESWRGSGFYVKALGLSIYCAGALHGVTLLKQN
jgi:hypothetical protein